MRRWLALSLLLVFGAGLGVGLTIRHLQEGTREAAPTSGRIDPFEDGWIYLVSSESVYDELQLTAAQREELDVALTSHFRNVTEVRQALRDVASGARDCAAARERLLGAGFSSVDYLEIRDAETLAPATGSGRPARVLGAAWLDTVRLIDNVAA